MADLHIIDDLGSAVVREIVNLLGSLDLVHAYTFPHGTATSWQDNEAHADPIAIYTAVGQKFVRGIFMVPAQNIASNAADNITITIRHNDVSAGTHNAIVAFQTIAADMATDPLVALTQYNLNEEPGGASTAFPDAGVVLEDGDSLTLEVTAAANGAPLNGTGLFLDVDPYEDRIVLEPEGIPDYKDFLRRTRTGVIA